MVKISCNNKISFSGFSIMMEMAAFELEVFICSSRSHKHNNFINIVMLELFCEMRLKDNFFGSWTLSALEHVIKLILCSCVLLVFINRICKHNYASAILLNQ